MPTDIEIARSVTPLPITEVAKNAGVDVKHLIPYGFDKAKVDYSLLNEPTDHQAKLVLVTAINPTPAGEGKTTTTIGLADGLRRRGVKSAVALREPSLGPVFGVKGGTAGGGWAQVIPMEDINLHFTGDFHAIGAANNLLAAMLDNHIQQGNQLGIDVKRITWKRVVDMNDRQLRHVIDGIGGKAQGVPREDGFDITVASEVMAILCLSTSINDLKERLGEIVVGYCGMEYGKGFTPYMMRVWSMMHSANWIARAVRHRPYRGTLLNFGFTKSLYFGVNGFSHLNMNIGEDDLFMQRVMRRDNVSVILSPRATLREKRWGGMRWWMSQLRYFGSAFRFYPAAVRSFVGWEIGSRSLFFFSVLAALAVMPVEYKLAALLLLLVPSS